MLSIWQGRVTLQTFADHPGATGYPEIKHGALKELTPWAVQKNQQGHGIYVTVNRTDDRGRKAENITGIRSYFTDVDGLPTDEQKHAKVYDLLISPLPPSAIVKSKNGLHVYWFAEPNQAVDPAEFKRTAQGISHHFGGDPKATDVSRVLRLPGYFHLKDPEAPYLVEIIWRDEALMYRESEIRRAYPPHTTRRYPPMPEAARRYVAAPREDWELVLEAVAAWPPVDGQKHGILMQVLGVGLKFNVPESRAVADLIPIVSSWQTREDPAKSVRTRARWAYQHGKPTTVAGLRSLGVSVPTLSRPQEMAEAYRGATANRDFN